VRAVATPIKRKRQVTYAPSGSSDKHFNLIRTGTCVRVTETYRALTKICSLEHKDELVDIMHRLRTYTLQALAEARNA
jgi:hypothetical protein